MNRHFSPFWSAAYISGLQLNSFSTMLGLRNKLARIRQGKGLSPLTLHNRSDSAPKLSYAYGLQPHEVEINSSPPA